MTYKPDDYKDYLSNTLHWWTKTWTCCTFAHMHENFIFSYYNDPVF